MFWGTLSSEKAPSNCCVGVRDGVGGRGERKALRACGQGSDLACGEVDKHAGDGERRCVGARIEDLAADCGGLGVSQGRQNHGSNNDTDRESAWAWGSRKKLDRNEAT